jgi:hypothetical protein
MRGNRLVTTVAALRIGWDAGAKGGKTRRVPITPKLAAAIERYEGRHRPDTPHLALLINELRRPYGRFGIAAMMDRLQRAKRLPRPCQWLPPHLRHRRNSAGLELRAAPSRDGPRRLQGVATLCAAGDGARLGAALAMDRSDRRQPGHRVVVAICPEGLSGQACRELIDVERKRGRKLLRPRRSGRESPEGRAGSTAGRSPRQRQSSRHAGAVKAP